MIVKCCCLTTGELISPLSLLLVSCYAAAERTFELCGAPRADLSDVVARPNGLSESVTHIRIHVLIPHTKINSSTETNMKNRIKNFVVINTLKNCLFEQRCVRLGCTS